MAGKTKISMGTIGGSSLMAAGYKTINHLINSNSRCGIFTKSGNPFYQGLVLYDNQLHVLDKTFEFKNFKLNDFFDDPTLGNESVENKNLVEAGATGFNYTRNNNITHYPVEKGRFNAVNKVVLALKGQVFYTSTGTEKQRKYFEDALEYASASLQVFQLLTTIRYIPNININGYTLSQTSESGGQMFKYIISIEEVQSTGIVEGPLDNATPFSGAGSNIGPLEMQPATGAQADAARKKP